MSVGFGFSVGDFITALQIVGIVIDAIGESSRACASFRMLHDELCALKSALLQVESLDLDNCHHVAIIALRQAASQCQYTIELFWKEVQKYQPHLQQLGAGSKLKDNLMKIKWAVCKKDHLTMFQAQIRGHTSSINFLLLAIHMEATADHARRQDSQHQNLAHMIQDLSCQAIGKLSAVTDSIAQSVQQGKMLLDLSARIVQTNLGVFRVMHNIQLFLSQMPLQVQRQQPVYMIDPLNRESPFHLEFIRSAEALRAVLKINLRDTDCGSAMVDNWEFAIQELGTRSPIDLCRDDWESCFYPGQRVAMSMVFITLRSASSSCPRCNEDCTGSLGDEVICTACGAVFCQTEKVARQVQRSEICITRVTPAPKYLWNENVTATMRKFRRLQIINILVNNGPEMMQARQPQFLTNIGKRSKELHSFEKDHAVESRRMSNVRFEEPGRTSNNKSFTL